MFVELAAGRMTPLDGDLASNQILDFSRHCADTDGW